MIKLHFKADPRVTIEIPKELFYAGDAIPDIYSVRYWDDGIYREMVLLRREWEIENQHF